MEQASQSASSRGSPDGAAPAGSVGVPPTEPRASPSLRICWPAWLAVLGIVIIHSLRHLADHWWIAACGTAWPAMTSAAIFVGKLAASKWVMGPIPDWPARTFFQASSVPMPQPQINPTPVTTTRRFKAESPSGEAPCRAPRKPAETGRNNERRFGGRRCLRTSSCSAPRAPRVTSWRASECTRWRP